MSTLGERIAYLRNKKGISQEVLAKGLKIGKSTLGMYETDKREPSYETIKKISDEFKVTIDWIVTGKDKTMDIDVHPKDQKIMELIEQLGDKGKDYIVDLMEKMVEGNKSK